MVETTGRMSVSRAELDRFAEGRSIAPAGDQTFTLTGVRPLDEAGPADIAFCRFEGEQGLRYLSDSGAAAIFVPESLAPSLPAEGPVYLPCKYPRLEMLRFIKEFWREPGWSFDPAANPCIHADARIAKDARIGPFTVIGPDVTVGPGVRIGSNCHIEHAVIGRDTIIANNTAIGGTGFGYEDDPETGEVLQFPHIGGVEIGNRVEIGSCTCVDRGSIGDTVIGDDCKIDNLIHVAHNVRMGRRCKVIALAIVGGSVTLGDDAWVAPAAAIRDWRNVGEKAVVGLGAVVTKDVPDGEVVIGNPAKPMPRTKHRYK